MTPLSQPHRPPQRPPRFGVPVGRSLQGGFPIEKSAGPTSEYKNRPNVLSCWVDSDKTELLNTQDLWNLLLILKRFTFLLYPGGLIRLL